MRILITNDDGYLAPGINALAEVLAPIAEITMVAPDSNRSGSSNSLTLERPLFVIRAQDNIYHVNGTPSDCVHIALTGLLPWKPDLVVSGINQGQNMGDDTLYSGTVAAATEGYLLGVPSLAVSLVSKSPQDFSTAAYVTRRLVERLMSRPLLQRAVLLNVNIPDLPLPQLKGYRVTRLGRRHKAEAVIPAQNPRGETVYWIGPAGKAAEAGEGTDFHAVAEGYVSITPLQMDLTHYELLLEVERWLQETGAP